MIRLLAAGQRDLLGQRVGHRLGDQRLAAAGRAVEQHTLRRPQLVLAEQVGVQERQLDGVPDLLDLPGQAADVAVLDVRHLLQHKVLDLGLGHPLVGVAGLGCRPAASRPASARCPSAARPGSTTRSSSACPTTSARSPSSTSRSEQTSPTTSNGAGLDDGQRLVQPDLLAALQACRRRPSARRPAASGGRR